MRFDDLLVATVAAGLGFATLLAGALNWEAAFLYRPARWVEAAYGRTAARLFYALLGLLLIGMGIAISQGWVLNRPRAGVSPIKKPLKVYTQGLRQAALSSKITPCETPIPSACC